MARIALVGCGRFAEIAHLPQYRDLGDKVELVAFVDPDQDRARLLRDQAGQGDVLSDIAQLPGPDQVDYVDVCVRHSLHEPIATALMAAGHDVLVEKPMALTTAACDRMIRAADRNNVRLGVGLHFRFAAGWVASHDFIQSGKAGRPLFASGTFLSHLGSFHDHDGAVSPWRAGAGEGGGALPDLGIYLADFFLWTLGDPVSVYAMRVAGSPSDPDGGEPGSEMTALVTATMPRGVGVSMQVTWDYPQTDMPASLQQGVVGYRVVCDGGILVSPDPVREKPVVFYPAGKNPPVDIDVPTLPSELARVVDAVDAGDDFPVPGREARRSVAFIEAALRSIATGTAVAPDNGNVVTSQ